MDNKTLIKQYIGIVQKIARVEHRRIPNHMIEYEELVSIGIIAVQTLIKGKTEEVGIQSLFAPGGTHFESADNLKIEDFELISFLIIRE